MNDWLVKRNYESTANNPPALRIFSHVYYSLNSIHGVLFRHNLSAGAGDGHTGMLKNILVITNLLLLGACSTGMVDGDIDLTFYDVSIKKVIR